MALLHAVLRFYSYIFHFALAILLLGLALVCYASGLHNLNLGMLPWTGEVLSRWLLGLGLVGLLAVILALTGVFRYLLPLYAAAACVMLFRGFFLGGYVFGGRGDFYRAIWLTLAALAAFLCSLLLFKRKRA